MSDSDSLQYRCDVCFETFPFTSFRLLDSCGHSFCDTCIDDTKRHNASLGLMRPPCPNCRKTFNPSKAVQIFLNPVPPAPHVLHVAQQSTSYGNGQSDRVRTILSRRAQDIGREVAVRLDTLERGNVSDASGVDAICRQIMNLVDVLEEDNGLIDVLKDVLTRMSLFLVDRTVTIITVLRDTRSQLAAVETNLSNTEEARKAIEAKRLALAKEVETLHRDLNVFTSQSSAMQAQIKRLNSQLQSKRMERLQQFAESILYFIALSLFIVLLAGGGFRGSRH